MKIFKLDFKRNFKTLLIWSLVSAAINVLLIVLYPSMVTSDFALFYSKISLMPKEMISALHMETVDFKQLPQYFGYIVQLMLIAASVYGLVLGMNALTRDQSEGTIEFLYTRPVKRSDIVGSKLSSALVSYLLYFAIFSASAIITSIAVKPDNISAIELVTAEKTMLLGCMIAGFTYLFLGMAVSVFLKKARHATSLAVAIFFALYILGVIPKMTGMLGFLKWASPMEYFVMGDIIKNGIDWVSAAVCAGIMALCVAITYPVYNRKDFIV
jgi:ABC-2 type transport system permease protein